LIVSRSFLFKSPSILNFSFDERKSKSFKAIV
jgi:hypothetical protein